MNTTKRRLLSEKELAYCAKLARRAELKQIARTAGLDEGALRQGFSESARYPEATITALMALTLEQLPKKTKCKPPAGVSSFRYSFPKRAALEPYWREG